MKALTGMNIVEFELLVPRIDDFISLNISSKKDRKRRIGGGRKGVLNSIELKLFFILFYLKRKFALIFNKKSSIPIVYKRIEVVLFLLKSKH